MENKILYKDSFYHGYKRVQLIPQNVYSIMDVYDNAISEDWFSNDCWRD